MFVSTNIRMLLPLSVTRFVYKRLNIIFAGYPHRFGGSGKGCLRFSDGRSGGVADNDLSILLLEEQDFIAGFQPKLPPDFYRHSDLTVCRDFRQIHTSHPFYSLEFKFSLSLLLLYPMYRRK